MEFLNPSPNMNRANAIIFRGPENDLYLTATNSRVCVQSMLKETPSPPPPPPSHPRQGRNQAVIHGSKPAGPSQPFFFSSLLFSSSPCISTTTPAPKIYTIPSPIFMPSIASHSFNSSSHLSLSIYIHKYTITHTYIYLHIHDILIILLLVLLLLLVLVLLREQRDEEAVL